MVRSEFELRSRRPRRTARRVRDLLRERSQDDAREWIHQSTLLATWDSLWLPPAVPEAWDGWIQEHRVHVAV